MSVSKTIGGFYRGQCVALFAERFQINRAGSAVILRGAMPEILRLVGVQMNSVVGEDELLEALNHPATAMMQTDPRGFADPGVRTTGESMLQRLVARDQIPPDRIEAIAREARASHHTVRATLPYVVLLAMAAIRQLVEADFRMILARFQPDDAMTDPFRYVYDNRTALRSRAGPIVGGSPEPAERRGLMSALLARASLPPVQPPV